MINPGRSVAASPCPVCGRTVNHWDFVRCLLEATADCGSLLELGCGMGDKLDLCKHVHARTGVDAYEPYVVEAARRVPPGSITFLCQDALSYVNATHLEYDGVLLIDLLEHLSKEDGHRLLRALPGIVRKRIVSFSPVGFSPQETDIHGMGGDYWQTHRSGWEPEDLEALGFDVAVWRQFHRERGDAMFAIMELEA